MFKAIPTISALIFFSFISITTFASILDTAITDEEKKQIKSLLSDLSENLMEEYTPTLLFDELISKIPLPIKEKTHIIFITHEDNSQLYSYSGQSNANSFHLVIIAQGEDNSVIVYDPIFKKWLPYEYWFLSFIHFKDDSDANRRKCPSWKKTTVFINSTPYTKRFSPLFFIFPFSDLWLPEKPYISNIITPISLESMFEIGPNSNTKQLFNNTTLSEFQENEKDNIFYLISLRPTYMNIFEARHLSLKSLSEQKVVTAENINTTGATAALNRLTAPQLSGTFELFASERYKKYIYHVLVENAGFKQ